MNENQIRPETGGVGKSVLTCHEEKDKKKTVKAEVCDNMHFKKSRIDCFATQRHTRSGEQRGKKTRVCAHC